MVDTLFNPYITLCISAIEFIVRRTLSKLKRFEIDSVFQTIGSKEK